MHLQILNRVLQVHSRIRNKAINRYTNIFICSFLSLILAASNPFYCYAETRINDERDADAIYNVDSASDADNASGDGNPALAAAPEGGSGSGDTDYDGEEPEYLDSTEGVLPFAGQDTDGSESGEGEELELQATATSITFATSTQLLLQHWFGLNQGDDVSWSNSDTSHTYRYKKGSLGWLILKIKDYESSIAGTVLTISSSITNLRSGINFILENVQDIKEALVEIYSKLTSGDSSLSAILAMVHGIEQQTISMNTSLNNTSSNVLKIFNKLDLCKDLLQEISNKFGTANNVLSELQISLGTDSIQNIKNLLSNIFTEINGDTPYIKSIDRTLDDNNDTLNRLFNALGVRENSYQVEQEVEVEHDQYSSKLEILENGVKVTGATGYEPSNVESIYVSWKFNMNDFSPAYCLKPNSDDYQVSSGAYTHSGSYTWTIGAEGTDTRYFTEYGIYADYSGYKCLHEKVEPVVSDDSVLIRITYFDWNWSAGSAKYNQMIKNKGTTFNVQYKLKDGSTYSYTNLLYPQSIGGEKSVIKVIETQNVEVTERLTISELLYRIWQATKNKYEVNIEGSNVSMNVDMLPLQAAIENLQNWSAMNHQKLDDIYQLLSLAFDDGFDMSNLDIDLSGIEGKLDAIIALLGTEAALDVIDALLGDMDGFAEALGTLSTDLTSKASGVFPFCIPAVVKQVCGLMVAEKSLPDIGFNVLGASLDLDFNSYSGMVYGFGNVTSWVCRITLVVVLLVNTRKFVYGTGVTNG